VDNPRDSVLFPGCRTFWLPYAASKVHSGGNVTRRERDVAFIGGLNQERVELFNRIGGVTTTSAFGDDYFLEMQKSKICLNLPIDYDINAKYFEIPASGTFMLAKAHEELQSILRDDMQVMFWKDEQDLKDKMVYYLAHDLEREGIAASARKYILSEHSWENRAKTILTQISST
jgi:spore maturation protein CgeB